MPFAWPRTQALVLALYSCRKTTLSWLGFWLKIFSLLSSGSLAGFGSSESVTAWGSVRILISSHSLERFSRTCAGVDWQASE